MAYIGKVKLRASKDEPERIIQGIHEPIIGEELFYAVQRVLDGKKAKSQPKNFGKKSDLPLRGFLICPRCGKILTGSASKGNGGKYFYYHCSQGCKERFRASKANDRFVELLEQIRPKEEVKPLYEAILKDLLLECESGKKDDLKFIDSEIRKINARLENLQDKLADDQIGISDYNSIKQRYEKQLQEQVEKKKNMVYVSKEVYDQLIFSFSFLKDLPSLYSEASLDVQQRIIGSIFPERLEFSKNNYRTKRINSVVELISNINKPFGRNENGQFSKKTELSGKVPGAGIEPARDCSHWFLRPTRLPVPPSGLIKNRTAKVMKILKCPTKSS